MKCSSTSSKATPPAVEMARAIGIVPVRRTGTALMSAASAVRRHGRRRARGCEAASCSRPIAAGDRFAALRRNVDSDCLPRGAARRCSSAAASTSGEQVDVQDRLARCRDGLAQRGRQRVDAAAFQASPW